MSGPNKVTGPVVIQQQPTTIKKEPQPADRKVGITELFKETNKLMAGADDTTKILAVGESVKIVHKVIPGASQVASLTNLAILKLHQSSDAEKLAAARAMYAHFPTYYQTLHQEAHLAAFKMIHENKIQPRINIQFTKCILTDLEKELSELGENTVYFINAVQEECTRCKTTDGLIDKNYYEKIESAIKGVNRHFKKYESTCNTAIDNLVLIEERKAKFKETHNAINNCIEEFKEQNKKDYENLKFIFEPIGEDIRGGVENMKYGRENRLMHSQFYPQPKSSSSSQSSVSNNILVDQSNFFQFLDKNLASYEKINKFTEKIEKFAQEVQYIRNQLSRKNNPNRIKQEVQAMGFPETYDGHLKECEKFYAKLEEHNNNLASIQEAVDKFMAEILNGLSAQENTIIEQADLLLTECNKLDKKINGQDATMRYQPLTRESRDKYPESKIYESGIK